MEIVDINDTITLDDNKKYFVAGKILYDDLDYISLFNPEDKSMKYGVLVEDQIVLLDKEGDKALIEDLFPLFMKNIQDEYEK